jgi:hypothetical protein
MLFVKTMLKKFDIFFSFFGTPTLNDPLNEHTQAQYPKLSDYALHTHTQIKQYINLDINLYIPCWISCKTNAFMRYFCNITAQMIALKMKVMVSVVDNIQISLVFFR